MVNALLKADFVIANSKFTKKLIESLGFNQQNIKVINPGCDYPKTIQNNSKTFAKNIFGDAFPKLITISRLDKRKSHQNILMTIKNILPKFPKLKYVSIGDGDERDNLQKLKNELNFTKEVIFLHKSSEQEKLALLDLSDLFIMPSVVYKKSVEGFGISFIEAASYGTPSIGGIYGGESDAILSGKTGYLCNGNDLSILYETILKSLENENYKKLGSNALEFSKNFKWDKIIKKYIELL
jgi:phosphatidylinositol alpha-1,6-mannosyltransferase